MYRYLFRTLYRARSHAVHAYEECVPQRKGDLNVTFLPLIRVANGGGPKGLSTSSISRCESKDGGVPPPREDEKRDAKKDGDLAETATLADRKVDDEHKIIETMPELPPEGNEMRAAKKDSDLAEMVTEGKVDSEHKLVETTPEQEETLAGVQIEVESTTQQQIDDSTREEVLAENQTLVEPETTKTEEKPDVTIEVDKEVEHTAVEETQQEQKEGETKLATKSGKESLLDLLGTMKVDLTTKKTFKSLKVQVTPEAPVKPKPAPMESTITMFQKATAESPAQRETLSPELVAAVSAAASTLPNKSRAESELLRQLRQHEAVTEDQRKGEASDIGGIIADMRVGKRPNARQNVRSANQIRFDDDGGGYTHDRGITSELSGVRRRRGLFSGRRLNIFPIPTDQDKVDTAVARPTLWDIDFTNQLVESVNNMPRNGLEEMIQWTKEGKLWQYPINNEAGLDEESLVPFHEHIFLEKHLEEGFPSQGPVRHFMELVVAGLIRNHCLTVQQKKDHIAWFKDYFQQKEDVLKEADVYLN